MAETWVFNNTVDDFEYGTYTDSGDTVGTDITPFWVSYDGTFISNGITYKGFLFGKPGGFTPPITSGSGITVYEDSSWIDEAYRTITFEEAPTGDFLTWLQANGTLTPSSPPSIADKLQDLIDIKQDIKEAIENKDVDLTDVDFGGYAEKIDLLPAVVELTQEDYDELSVYDDNTYYLIVEEE